MKRLYSLVLIICLLFIFTACGTSDADTNKKIYYVRIDKNGIVPVDYKLNATTVSSKVREVIDLLTTDVDNVDYMRTVPVGVEIEEWNISDGNVALYLSDSYSNLEPFTEILVRSAIVKSLVQIEGVDSVSIYVDYTPFTDSTGALTGAMTADTFIDDFGEETDSLLNSEIVLYFASADGTTLVAETREVYYSRNVAIEKLIVEQLMKGPKTDGLISTIPSETKLLSVSLTGGICYVNFDSGIETAKTGITENATIYSIVNSLCELNDVKQVQILVNGENPHFSNVEDNLSNPLDKKADIIIEPTEEDGLNEYIDGELLLDSDGNPLEIEVKIMGE